MDRKIDFSEWDRILKPAPLYYQDAEHAFPVWHLISKMAISSGMPEKGIEIGQGRCWEAVGWQLFKFLRNNKNSPYLFEVEFQEASMPGMIDMIDQFYEARIVIHGRPRSNHIWVEFPRKDADREVEE